MKVDRLFRRNENVLHAQLSKLPRPTTKCESVSTAKGLTGSLNVASVSQSGLKPQRGLISSNTAAKKANKKSACVSENKPPTMDRAPSPSLKPNSTHATPLRIRVPSRTQLRQASAARRLSQEGHDSTLPSSRQHRPSPPRSTLDHELSISLSKLASQQRYVERGRLEHDEQTRRENLNLPLLSKTLEVAQVSVMADSASLESKFAFLNKSHLTYRTVALQDHRVFLNASYLTPASIMEHVHDDDVFYHVWVAVTLALDEINVFVQ